MDATAGTMTLGAGNQNTTCQAGAGTLDLGEASIRGTDATSYQIIDIYKQAFNGNTSITNLVLPTTLLNIGERAFGAATGLRDLTLRAPGLTNLSSWAFTETTMTNVNLSMPALRSIGGSVLGEWGKPNIALRCDIADWVPPSVESIGANAFMCCTNLYGCLTLTNISYLGEGVIRECPLITEVRIESPRLRNIPPYLFYHCTGLTNGVFDIPNVTNIGSQVFIYQSGRNPMRADIGRLCPPGVQSLGSWALAGCTNFYGNLVLTNVASIGECAFIVTKVEDLRIESPTLSSIGNEAFSNSGITNGVFDVPNLRYIGRSAFYSDSKMNADIATLCPPGVTNAGENVFRSCNALYGCLRLTNMVMFQSYAFQGCHITDLILEAPGAYVFKDNVFSSISTLTNVVIGSAEAIATNNWDQWAFNNDANLKRVTFWGPAPDSQIVDNILRSVAVSNAGPHACVLAVSRMQEGWLNLAAPTNGYESGHEPKGEMLLGVYREGSRKAWMVRSASTYDKMGFSIHICDSELVIPYDWITNVCPTVAWNDDVAVSNALISVGANGFIRWQSYALGLDPNRAEAVVLCDVMPDAAADAVTFYARNVEKAKNGMVSIDYRLLGSRDGAAWNQVATARQNAIPVALPSDYSFFRMRTDIVILQ